MKHTTTWSPDTCDCILHYEWDDQEGEDIRVHIPVDFIKTHTGEILNRKVCQVHQNEQTVGAGGHQNHYDIVLEENKRKNRVYGHVLENYSDLVDISISPDGSQTKNLKPGIEYQWFFDEKRILHVKIKGATPEHSKSLQSDTDKLFGNNKVIIE